MTTRCLSMLTAPTVRQGHRLSEPRPRIRSSHQILASWWHWGFIPAAWSRPARPDCIALPPGCPHARRAVVGGVDLMQGEGGWATKKLQATFNLLASRMPVQTLLRSCCQPRKHRLTNIPYSLKPTGSKTQQQSRQQAQRHKPESSICMQTPKSYQRSQTQQEVTNPAANNGQQAGKQAKLKQSRPSFEASCKLGHGTLAKSSPNLEQIGTQLTSQTRLPRSLMTPVASAASSKAESWLACKAALQ
jgi:hypothetical protein